MSISVRRLLIGAALAAAAATTVQAEPAATATGDDRIICRKTAEIGSLVRKKKECFTKREWDDLAEAHQRGVKKVTDGLTEKYNCVPEPGAPPC